ncbi:olfactory receptor 1038-like [Bombina bombina]|uniref:olfactory receptor 1038-like n=1 Tax=Bombina bombina TaxID=8345 RepID=UPI00235A90F6|nr:olfactory receptor 1038-like [Bombina bombina]
METINQTLVSYFIIKGISDVPEFQVPVFLLVLLIYLTVLGGNMTILHLVCQDNQLHTPMYFFLGNLSLIDISYTSITLPKVLFMFISGDNTISFFVCFTQFYVFSSSTSYELLLLTAMGYDRYVAICKPLHYHTIMNRRACVLLTSVCWCLGFLEPMPFVILLAGISCYTSKIINHFFCDLVPLLQISCTDTSLLETLVFTEGMFLTLLTPFILTCISYAFIMVTILKIRSNTGRRKAFYTCASHLTVVVLLYATLICQYMRPATTNSLDSNKLFSLFNAIALPLLNPLIYSLKNKDVKSALKRRLRSI